jgi:head-tail adaptor
MRARQVQNNQNLQVIVSYNPKITTNLYLEFGGKTYKVVSIDPYEFNKTDLEIRAEEVSPPAFDEEEYAPQ